MCRIWIGITTFKVTSESQWFENQNLSAYYSFYSDLVILLKTDLFLHFHGFEQINETKKQV